ncbi:hypothetical protein L0337_03700 [candidate division KSB1 bacterium]|nr:hypothetical protein [candidate division KSB1 bacterium]
MTRTILLIDDDASLLLLLGNALKMASYDVHAFRWDDEALSFLEGGSDIHAIVFDFQIPGRDITDFILRLKTSKSFEKYRDVHKILLTTFTMSQLYDSPNFPKIKDECNDIVLKEHGYSRKVVEKLNNFLNKTTSPDVLRTIEENEQRVQESHGHMVFSASDPISVEDDFEITITEHGIRDLLINLSQPRSLKEVTKIVSLLAVATLESNYKELSQDEKASMLGIKRMTYSRLLKELNFPKNEKIKNFEKVR